MICTDEPVTLGWIDVVLPVSNCIPKSALKNNSLGVLLRVLPSFEHDRDWETKWRK